MKAVTRRISFYCSLTLDESTLNLVKKKKKKVECICLRLLDSVVIHEIYFHFVRTCIVC